MKPIKNKNIQIEEDIVICPKKGTKFCVSPLCRHNLPHYWIDNPAWGCYSVCQNIITVCKPISNSGGN